MTPTVGRARQPVRTYNMFIRSVKPQRKYFGCNRLYRVLTQLLGGLDGLHLDSYFTDGTVAKLKTSIESVIMI